MKINKNVKTKESKRKLPMIDFKNTKSITWNSKRRFGIQRELKNIQNYLN